MSAQNGAHSISRGYTVSIRSEVVVSIGTHLNTVKWKMLMVISHAVAAHKASVVAAQAPVHRLSTASGEVR